MGLDDLCSVSWIQGEHIQHYSTGVCSSTVYRTHYVLYTVQLCTVRSSRKPMHVCSAPVHARAWTMSRDARVDCVRARIRCVSASYGRRSERE